MSLDDLVRRQGGVLAVRPAVAAGMSAATVQRRAREGSWRRLHPAVYLLAGHRLTDEVRVRAAWLWAGEATAVSGPAAYWHGMLDRAPRIVEVTVPRGRSPRCRTGCGCAAGTSRLPTSSVSATCGSPPRR